MRHLQRQNRIRHPVPDAASKKKLASSTRNLFIFAAITVGSGVAVSILLSVPGVAIAILLLVGVTAYVSVFRYSVGVSNQSKSHFEPSDDQPMDEMTKHLKRGDTVHLGTDGEIYFKKALKQTERTHKRD